MARFQHRAVEEALPLSRRDFLISMAGAAVAFGFARTGAVAAATPAFDPTIWYSIDRDGIVTVNIIRAEMGQHVGTALARILAEELEADWDKVRIVAVDTDPKWGLMVTGGSWSVWMTFPVFSRAGAAGRVALVEEGAKLLGVSADQCLARNSSVVAGNRSISYAEIVQRGNLTRTFTADELAQMPIKPASQRRLIGHKVNAIDIPEKTNGTTRYGIDAAVEGMVYARPKIPPTRNGARVRSIDDSAARSVKGYISSLALEDPSNTVPGWVMVFASSYPAAIRAADLVKVDWVAGDGANVSERDILDHGAKQIADAKGGVLLVDDPGLEAAFQHASSTLERTYTTGSVLHVQLEPVNALAFEKDGIFEIHTGNQWQSLILPVLAKALGLPQERIVLRTYSLGGGFGRRLNGDYTVPAALAAKALGKPVKMVLTRPDDMRFDSFRSPSIQTLRVAFAVDGKVVAMEHHASAGWPTAVMAQGFMANGTTWVRSAYGRCRTTLPTALSDPAGCARSGPAGPTGRSSRSWMRRPVRLTPIRSPSAFAYWMAQDATPAWLPTPSAAQDAKRRWSSGRRKRPAGAPPCRRTRDLVSRPHLARNATCRPGSLVSRASGSSAATVQ
jgi:isoquinoline 1-oxidoreductase subunit beta